MSGSINQKSAEINRNGANPNAHTVNVARTVPCVKVTWFTID